MLLNARRLFCNLINVHKFNVQSIQDWGLTFEMTSELIFEVTFEVTFEMAFETVFKTALEMIFPMLTLIR